jgi:hypothetical protein
MPEMTRSLIAVAVLGVLVACGGGGDPGPQPLSHHFEDYLIAPVNVGEKQAVFKAQNDYHIAKGEFVTTQTRLDDNATRRAVAENEIKQARLDEDSANSRMKNAEASGDMNRVNAVKSEIRAAEVRRQASEQKVRAVKAERKYLEKHLRYAEEQMYAEEAKFELAKAEVAVAKNIRPKNFQMADYKEQYADRSRRAQRARALADQEKATFLQEKKKLDAMKQDAQRAAGGGSGGSGGGAGGN